jgi:tRNA pseudouridine55 synthase
MNEEISGVVVIDKPVGPTSHDVVGKVRRTLGTKRVGHAGTLDPMASGVLVILVGEATKLGPYLTADRKRYRARVAFGTATDTLDREGRVTAEAEVPAWLRDELAGEPRPRLEAAFAAERARVAQVPPAFSAIQVGGRRSYDLARAGEAVELAERPVQVIALGLAGADPLAAHIDLDLEVTKGFYVRSLARDLGDRLGVPSHLAALRRTASGSFTLDAAAQPDAGPDALRGALHPLDAAARAALPAASLTAEGALRARQGKRLGEADFTVLPPVGEPSAWFDPGGCLVAVGERAVEGSFSVLRGFVPR